MDDDRRQRIESLLRSAVEGEAGAKDALMETVYSEVRAMARQQLRCERPNHSWQATDLVNLTYLKLFTGRELAKSEAGYFYGAVWNAMRQLLVDHAKHRSAQKRPDPTKRNLIDDILDQLHSTQRASFLDLNDCLDRLAAIHQRHYQVVYLRFFLGLPWKEIADQLDVKVSTVEKDWQKARAFLRSQLDGAHHDA